MSKCHKQPTIKFILRLFAVLGSINKINWEEISTMGKQISIERGTRLWRSSDAYSTSTVTVYKVIAQCLCLKVDPKISKI